ncbi:hypothetical protein Cni_G01468 [Canna indica]|uniref:Sec-independent protein translocase protein TATB, chloroplastic n=1 Tax=Canna indica TaxID=4628 RepID=A0AAQ3JN98_9LILI|nr:hypothetical protein Cni_G01468 [Canna indica]
MGAATLLPSICCGSSSPSSQLPKTVILSVSSPPLPRVYPKCSSLSRARRSIPGLSLGPLPLWSGLKQLGSPISYRNFSLKDKKAKCRGKIVYASLFGVGAPEALVIGVVALLVFGPKGLAEVARNLGKTFRAFQPTIRELQEVSREFKNTLEREIGMDEVASSANYINKSALYADEKQESVVDPNGKPSAEPYSSEEVLKVTEEQLAASTATSQTEPATPKEQPQESTSETLAATTTTDADAATTSTESSTTPTDAATTRSDSQVQSSEKAESQV